VHLEKFKVEYSEQQVGVQKPHAETERDESGSQDVFQLRRHSLSLKILDGLARFVGLREAAHQFVPVALGI
jgi:hypothetical protein